MKFHVSELVITPENKQSAQRLLNVTQQHDKPELLYVCGPANSGKSTFMESRAAEKDLLSTKHALYCHASEILVMLTIENENADTFLNRIGEVNVLFIDDVDDFLQDEAMGAKACKLLVESRTKQGLDTVVSSRVPLSDLDEQLRSALAGFEEVVLCPLGPVGARALARSFAKHFTQAKGKQSAPENEQSVNELSDEAFEYVATRFADSPKDMAPAIEFLTTVASVSGSEPISAAEAEELLTL